MHATLRLHGISNCTLLVTVLLDYPALQRPGHVVQSLIRMVQWLEGMALVYAMPCKEGYQKLRTRGDKLGRDSNRKIGGEISAELFAFTRQFRVFRISADGSENI